MLADLVNANSMLTYISKLQFQQIVKHPKMASVGTQNLLKIYTYKVTDKTRQTRFGVI